MQVIDRSTHASEYWPGIRAIFGEYENLTAVYKAFYGIETSEKAFEEFLTERAGLGLAYQQPELAPVNFDLTSDGARQQVTHCAYGLAVAISREAKDDNLYEDISARLARELNLSARRTEEYIAHAPLQLAFDGTLGNRFDGVPLISTSHPTPAGLMDNTLVAQDISELFFEDAVIRISYLRNPRGHLINSRLKRVIISPESGPECRRILGSPLQPNSESNNINVLRITGAIPEVVETPFLIDKDATFMQTTEQDTPMAGLTWFERSGYEVREDSNWSNQASLMAMWFRGSTACPDWRAIFGSPGSGA